MPNSKTHRLVGAGVGASKALVQARGQKPLHMAIETTGGVLAGYYGGGMADVLEPATSPNHRGPAHSVVTLSMVVGLCFIAHHAAHMCRHYADRAAEKREQEEDWLIRTLYLIGEVLLRLLAGACNALAPSYASHLVLDATTPKSLPII